MLWQRGALPPSLPAEMAPYGEVRWALWQDEPRRVLSILLGLGSLY